MDPSSMFAKAKGGAKPPAAGGEAESDSYESSEKAELPPDFEDYALTAFPELEGDEARLSALWKAMKACMRAGGMKG